MSRGSQNNTPLVSEHCDIQNFFRCVKSKTLKAHKIFQVHPATKHQIALNLNTKGLKLTANIVNVGF